MITNIKLKGMYNVGVNNSGHIDVNGTNVLLKDIPFIRYDFEKYDTEEVEYIKKSIEKFNMSTHMIQYTLSDRTLLDIANTAELHDKVAKFLYLTVTDACLAENQIQPEVLTYASQAMAQCKFDRVMLIDKTSFMDMAGARKMMKQTAKTLNIQEKNVGICSSPLCMTDNLACLTAVTARELAAIYATSSGVTSPSANHQDMNCCGCMRFFVVNSDIVAPLDKGTKTKKSSSGTEGSVKKSSSQPKKSSGFSFDSFI